MTLGQTLLGTELNIYAAPAILTLVLLVAETAFLALTLPETRGKRLGTQQNSEKSDRRSGDHRQDGKEDDIVSDGHLDDDGEAPVAPVRPAEQRIKILKSLRVLHFLFLGIFSGVEFTLTFLTFDRA